MQSRTNRLIAIVLQLLAIPVLRVEAMVNKIPANAVVSKTSSASWWLEGYCNDGSMYTECSLSGMRYAGDYMQYDLNQSELLQTIYMAQYLDTSGGVDIEVYAGDLPATDPNYQTMNTQCHLGGMEGFADCGSSISARYIIFVMTQASQALGFAEVLAWNAPSIQISAAAISGMTLTGLTYGGGGPISRMFGSNDSQDNDCPNFSGTGTMEFDLPASSTVASLFIQGMYTKSNWAIDLVKVYVLDASSVWQSCTDIDMSASVANYHVGYSDCGAAGISGTSVKLEFANTGDKICKIGVFAPDPCAASLTVTEDPQVDPNETFDLLLDTALSIALPTVSITPAGCYSVAWTVHLTSSEVDMAVTYPSSFVIGTTDLQISHSPSVVADRLTLFGLNAGSGNLYFQGMLSDAVPTLTQKIFFTVYFADACRSATITPQSINFPFVTWSVDATAQITVTAFTDSVDSTGTYSTGVCGEKRITLDLGSPAFLSIAYDATDPVLNGFKIDYSAASATSLDIGSHTVAYAVTIVDYSGVTTDLSGSFEFEIRCPASGITYTEGAMGSALTTFDLLADTSVQIGLPVLTSAAQGCFSVSWQVFRSSDGANMETQLPAVFTIVGETHLEIQHDLMDFNERLELVSSGQDFYVVGTVTNATPTTTSQIAFQIQFTDACRSATVQTQTISMPPVRLTEDTTAALSVAAFQDSVDLAASYTQGICGEKTVALDAGSPAFLTLTPDTVDPVLNDFTITYLDANASEADIYVHTIYYTVVIKEYSAVNPSSTHAASFLFQIDCPVNVAQSTLLLPIAEESKYDLASGTSLTLALPDVTIYPASCFTLTGFRILEQDTMLAPVFMTLGASTVEVATNDLSLLGSQTFTIEALVDNGQAIQAHEFSITFYACSLAELVQNEAVGTIETTSLAPDAVTKTFAGFTDTLSDLYAIDGICGPLSYSFLKPFPSFISVAHAPGESSYSITVDTSAFASDGSFTATMLVQLVEHPEIQMNQDVLIKVLPLVSAWQPPEPVEKKIRIQQLPIIEDEVQIDEIAEEESRPSSQSGASDKGRTETEAEALAELIRDTVNEDQRAFPFPRPFISEVTQTGEVIILFTRAIKDIPPEINLKTLEYEAEPDLWKPVLTVTVEPSLMQEPENVAMNWSIQNWSPSKIELQLEFERPLYVSFEKEPDFLVVNFADPDLFITENGIQIPVQHRTLRRNLMRQLPQDQISLQETLTQVAQGAQGAATAIIAANMLLAIGLQQIFGMIQALQIVILLPLMNSSMPANTGMFFNQLAAIAAFDFFEIGDYLNDWFGLDSKDPVNEKFETIGMESIYFMNNLGTFVVILLTKILIVLAWALMYPLELISKKIRRRRRRLGGKIFWNSWITLVTESFAIVGLCAMISFKYNFEFSSGGQSLQTVVCLATMLLYIVLPLFALFKTMQDFDQITSREMKHQFGAFYEGKAIKRGKKVLLHPVLFLARRLFLVVLVVAGTKVFIYQMTMLMASTIAAAIVVFLTEAFELQKDKHLNTFAEFCILTISYCFFCFDLIDVEQNNEVGYFPIAFTGLYICVCLLLIIAQSIGVLILRCKKRCAIYRYQRQRSVLQQRIKNTHDTRLKKFLEKRVKHEEEDSHQSEELGTEAQNLDHKAQLQPLPPQVNNIGSLIPLRKTFESDDVLSKGLLLQAIPEINSGCSSESKHEEEDDSESSLSSSSSSSSPSLSSSSLSSSSLSSSLSDEQQVAEEEEKKLPSQQAVTGAQTIEQELSALMDDDQEKSFEFLEEQKQSPLQNMSPLIPGMQAIPARPQAKSFGYREARPQFFDPGNQEQYSDGLDSIDRLLKLAEERIPSLPPPPLEPIRLMQERKASHQPPMQTKTRTQPPAFQQPARHPQHIKNLDNSLNKLIGEIDNLIYRHDAASSPYQQRHNQMRIVDSHNFESAGQSMRQSSLKQNRVAAARSSLANLKQQQEQLLQKKRYSVATDTRQSRRIRFHAENSLFRYNNNIDGQV